MTGTSAQPYWEKTGFNENVCWVSATFRAEGANIKIEATGWLLLQDVAGKGTLGLIGERCKDTAGMAESVSEIMKHSANSVNSAVSIYANMSSGGASSQIQTALKGQN